MRREKRASAGPRLTDAAKEGDKKIRNKQKHSTPRLWATAAKQKNNCHEPVATHDTTRTLVVAQALGRLERRFSALGARLEHLVLQPRRRLGDALLQLVGGQECNPFL